MARPNSLATMGPLSLALALLGCGAANASPDDGAYEPEPIERPQRDAPTAPTARAVARYACDADGQWSLTYTISDTERGCDDGDAAAALLVVQRAGVAGDAQRFEFRLGTNHGEGAICRAPQPCSDEAHTFAVIAGDPPRVEWSLSLGDEMVEHGSAAVLLCNDAPPPPCVLPGET